MLNIDTTATLAQMNALSTPASSTSEIKTLEDKQLKEKTDEFEAIMIKILLDQSMKTKNYLFPEKPGDKIYQSMYRDALSKEVSGSFGFSELLFNHLKEQQNL